jgi:hypothetical protein
VASLLGAVGLPSTCGGCEKRQKWLNELDEHLELTEKGAVHAFKKAMGWK